MPNLQHQSPHEKLTSRERVLKAIHHEEADRLPIDLGGMASTGIMAVAYHQLMQNLGLPTDHIRVFDVGQQLAEVAPALLSRFDVDVISLENSLGKTCARCSCSVSRSSAILSMIASRQPSRVWVSLANSRKSST